MQMRIAKIAAQAGHEDGPLPFELRHLKRIGRHRHFTVFPAWTNRYGNPAYIPNGAGDYVRYQSPWDPVTQTFTARTTPHNPNTPFQGTCYSPLPLNNAGGDHYGPRPLVPTTTVSYRWMFPDPANPGKLIAGLHNLFVPTPVYSFVPAPIVGNPPDLVAEVVEPPPPPAPIPQYGEATWMKVYENEIDRHVTLEEPVDTNAVVPQDPTQIETDWQLMQASPPGNGHRQRGKHVNQRALRVGTRAVIRRYETYTYTGPFDPATHEVMCGGDGSCKAPLDGELGDMQVAQMAAANVAIPGLTIVKTGSGTVSSSDKLLSCGSKCVALYPLNAVVSLTAQAASNFSFSGWTGACVGTAKTCDVTIADEMNVTATFSAVIKTAAGGGGGGSTGTQFTLSVGKSNTGTVTATPAGTDRLLDCGNACSAKFNANSAVTLTATPPAGKTFLGWSGACAGTSPACAVSMSKDLSALAGFSK